MTPHNLAPVCLLSVILARFFILVAHVFFLVSASSKTVFAIDCQGKGNDQQW